MGDNLNFDFINDKEYIVKINYANKIINKDTNDMVKEILINLRKKYAIGNFISPAMKLTRFTEKDSDSLAKAMNEDKRGHWILHTPKKLLYHNRYNRCTDYTFKHNYSTTFL